jgi:hypothetical protein
VDIGSRKENASKQEFRAFPRCAEMLWSAERKLSG